MRITDYVRTKCMIFGEALRIRGKIFKRHLPENCSKSTKMTITITGCKFLKILRGNSENLKNMENLEISPDPPRAVLVPQLASN